jgi:hypothetical protein
MPLPPQFREYTKLVPKALIQFQFIEETLKLYLVFTENIISLNTKRYFPYTSSEPAIKKLPLGKLLSMFTCRNSNKSLQQRLNTIPEKRNFYAHEAYTTIIKHAAAGEASHIASKMKDLEGVIVEAKECLHLLNEELSLIEDA